MYADSASDATLITAVRRGDTAAYGVLYQRHLSAAKRAAGCLAATPAEREDLVAEAFTRVLRTLRAGRGPGEDFRPYLLVTLRHLAIDAGQRNPPPALFADLPEAVLGSQPAVEAAEEPHGAVAHAFAGLPERWRMVLWHTEIEGESPADIAPLLGMTPNGVAALAYRAREGLRRAYLHQHVPAVDRRDCQATREKLAGWVRGRVSGPQQRRIEAHLARCHRCKDLADGLTRVNGELPAILAAVVLGAPLAASYLKPAVWTGIAAVSWLSGVQAAITTAAVQAGATAAVATVTAVTVAVSGPGAPVPPHQEVDRAVSGPQSPGSNTGQRPGHPPNPGQPKEMPAVNTPEDDQGEPGDKPAKAPKPPEKAKGKPQKAPDNQDRNSQVQPAGPGDGNPQ